MKIMYNLTWSSLKSSFVLSLLKSAPSSSRYESFMSDRMPLRSLVLFSENLGSDTSSNLQVQGILVDNVLQFCPCCLCGTTSQPQTNGLSSTKAFAVTCEMLLD